MIRIDDDVYAVLSRGLSYGVTENAALRALLGLPPQDPLQPRPPSPAATGGGRLRTDFGKLAVLVAAGLLRDGEVLTWHRSQRGDVHTATVSHQGHLVTADGIPHLSPDSCATALAGYPVRGWKLWRTSDGTTVHELRSRLQHQHTRPEAAGLASTNTGAAAGDR